MKLKLLITLLGGIVNGAIHGADPMLGGDDTGKPEVEEVREVIPPHRAEASCPLVRSNGGGLLSSNLKESETAVIPSEFPTRTTRLGERDPNISASKTDAAPLGIPPRPLNLGDGTPRTNSDLLESEGVLSEEESKTGSPKAADAASTQNFLEHPSR